MVGPGEFAPTYPSCPQCGFSHPPLGPGIKCSLAKDKIGDKEVDLNSFFIRLKPILISSIQKKGIKNLSKLYTTIILSLQKILDDYKE
jgi:hypothetical protein